MENEPTRSDRVLNLAIAIIVAVAAFRFWEMAKAVLVFVVTLGFLVAIHEWGHFIAARFSGVRVYEFALGMGPKLWTYMRRAGTDYTIRALPLGGFVNPKGMQPDDPITPDGLNGRRPAERALVYLAGPLMNVILAVVMLMLTGCLAGTPDDHQLLVGDVQRKIGKKPHPSPASQMEVLTKNGQPVTDAPRGLRVGDQVLAINGQTAVDRDAIIEPIHRSPGKRIELKIRRGADELVMAGVPELTEENGTFPVVGSVPANNELGLQAGDQISMIDNKLIERYATAKDKDLPDMIQRVLREKQGQQITMSVWRNGDTPLDLHGTAVPLDVKMVKTVRKYAIFGFAPIAGQGPKVSFAESLSQGKDHLTAILGGLWSLVSHPKTMGGQVSGPVGIFVMLGQVDRLPAFYYANIVAQLSLSLAIFNLLPIPLLDGGHMLVLTVEVLRRRRLDPETQRKVSMVGLVIIGGLFVIVLGNDLLKQFG